MSLKQGNPKTCHMDDREGRWRCSTAVVDTAYIEIRQGQS
jgi:hypothetical protein